MTITELFLINEDSASGTYYQVPFECHRRLEIRFRPYSLLGDPYKVDLFFLG
jgi:hypothetical protein